ncbi:MAG TPA: succinate dehydrogenase, hydrophobic membrane anchor protein [Rhizomicrobium sp.]|jgi:succinate dehydrogenase / fumarate reductase membrane anchor subunit|nr:succinate dehydrogenase, hydrophobic membrane anchor protein [Rhizomicrobium sp.]
MTTPTPLARVEGLGAAHSGTGHFWRQRVSAVALIPLSVWFMYAAVRLVGADRDAVVAFLHQPVNAIAMALFVVAALHHGVLGLQVVIEDYVHTEGWKITLFLLNQLLAWTLGAVSLFALVKIAL